MAREQKRWKKKYECGGKNSGILTIFLMFEGRLVDISFFVFAFPRGGGVLEGVSEDLRGVV